jgi:PST family polysaccharide transporter
VTLVERDIPETSITADAGEVGRLVQAGARWSLANNVVIRLGTLISGIVLARLLTPTDYGVYAVALVALTVLLSMNELGVGLAIVRWDRDLRSFAPTVMTLAITSSVLLYLACYALAPSLATLMNAPQATGVLRLLCILVVFDGISTVPSGILSRRFLQARRFVADLSNFALATTVTIILAIADRGAMSLAIGRIAGGIVGMVLIWVFSPIRFGPGWDREQARELVRFGLPLAGASLLVLMLLNIDYIIVGKTLGPVELGFYLMAFNLSSWPVNMFAEAARRVSFAGFSRLAHRPADFGRTFQRGIGLLGAATVPVCALLAGYARPLVEVLYGERWLPAASALEILAVLGLVRVVYFIGYDALVALGRSRSLIAMQLGWLVLLIPALIVGARSGGIRGVSVGHVVVAVLAVIPALFYTLSRHGVSPVAVLRTFGWPLLGGAAIVIGSVMVQAEVQNPMHQLIIGGLLSFMLYFPVLFSMRSILPAWSRAKRSVAHGGGE